MLERIVLNKSCWKFGCSRNLDRTASVAIAYCEIKHCILCAPLQWKGGGGSHEWGVAFIRLSIGFCSVRAVVLFTLFTRFVDVLIRVATTYRLVCLLVHYQRSARSWICSFSS